MLRDGQVHVFEVYAATVLWDGQPRVVETDETDTIPLIGMGLLAGYEVRLQVIDGGLVTIEALA
jgi:predicted aspartyl protease